MGKFQFSKKFTEKKKTILNVMRERHRPLNEIYSTAICYTFTVFFEWVEVDMRHLVIFWIGYDTIRSLESIIHAFVGNYFFVKCVRACVKSECQVYADMVDIEYKFLW